MEEQEKKPMAVPQYPPVYYYREDEITLKELILKFQEYLREFRLNLDISTAQLTALTYENEFLNLLLEQTVNQGTPIKEQLIKHYGSQLFQEDSKIPYELQSLLHRKEGKEELGLLVVEEDRLQATTKNETLSFAFMDGVIQLFQHYIYQEILQKKKAATTYLTEQQSFVESALLEQQELKKSIGAFAREEADKTILNYINQKNDLKNKLNQLTLLNILEAPSVKITQRTVTPEVIGSSWSKIIVIGSILGVFLALGWVVVRKIIRDALS